MKRTKQWWNQLLPEERVELCALEKASNQLGFRGGGLPDDCSSCTFCGSPHLGVGLCIHCGNTLSRLIRKANNGNEILVLRSRVALLEAGINHIIKWCKQSHSLFSVNQLAKAIGRMCKDVLQENET